MRKITDYFQGRTAVIANKHKKEVVIAPLLENHLGLKIIVPEEIDTDQFGTFTRDVVRKGTQLEAARAKAEEGMRLTGADIGIASEGTFGPHPDSPFISANTEIVVLLDKKHGLEIIGGNVSLKTNENHRYVNSVEEAKEFAQAIGFPSHGLVIRAHPDISLGMVKGITTEEQLEKAIKKFLKVPLIGKVFLETDMRAYVNPTRMENIKLATEDLIKNAKRTCPKCGIPGFSISKKEPGLPCETCGLKTDMTLADIYTCKKCNYIKKELYPDGKKTAYAGNCGYCNP